jgi:hypothetical protein
MAIAVDDVFFPDSIAVHMTCTRQRSTFVKGTETGFEPFRRAILPNTIRRWQLQSLPRMVIDQEGLADDVETVWNLWETQRGRLYNFKFRPPVNRTVRSGQGIISGGVYYQVYKSFDPDGTLVRSSARAVLPDDDVVVGGGGTTWTGTFHVAVRFDDDEFEEEVEGDTQALVLPQIALREVILA